MEIKCKDCGKVFEISSEEMAWYNEKGFEIPKRCKECRTLRRRNKSKENK